MTDIEAFSGPYDVSYTMSAKHVRSDGDYLIKYKVQTLTKNITVDVYMMPEFKLSLFLIPEATNAVWKVNLDELLGVMVERIK